MIWTQLRRVRHRCCLHIAVCHSYETKCFNRFGRNTNKKLFCHLRFLWEKNKGWFTIFEHFVEGIGGWPQPVAPISGLIAFELIWYWVDGTWKFWAAGMKVVFWNCGGIRKILRLSYEIKFCQNLWKISQKLPKKSDKNHWTQTNPIFSVGGPKLPNCPAPVASPLAPCALIFGAW